MRRHNVLRQYFHQVTDKGFDETTARARKIPGNA
jgi:hypothetical protein